jgi:hypothetical protein
VSPQRATESGPRPDGRSRVPHVLKCEFG